MARTKVQNLLQESDSLRKHCEGFCRLRISWRFFSHLLTSQPGFITDGNSKLVGSARIRQVRVKGNTCPVDPQLQLTVQECRASYSFDAEDTSDYGERWNASSAANSSELNSAWQYQSQAKLRGHPIWGKLAVYRGGGYVVHLGTDSHNASRCPFCLALLEPFSVIITTW